MDAPSIRYATTADGASIAYWAAGHGDALLLLPNPSANHTQFAWDVPNYRAFLEALVDRFRVVSYDYRGTALSEPTLGDFEYPSSAWADAVAVLDAAGVEACHVIGEEWGVLVALALAAYAPERVARLLLWNGLASSTDYEDDGRLAPTWQLAIERPDLWYEIVWPVTAKESYSEEVIPTVRKLIEHSLPTDRWGDLPANTMTWDSTPFIARIEAQATVVSRRDCGHVPPSAGRRLASLLPNCSFRELEGYTHLIWDGDLEQVLDVVDDAFGVPDEGRSRLTNRAPGPFQTIMFTDLESSTALTQRLGDAGAQDVLHGHNDAVRKSLEAHGGREVKHTGDGIMAAFPSAVRAVEAALQIQRDLSGAEVRVRIGLNAGEPIAEDDDFFGTAVQLAARICDRAEPGQVLVSRVVADLCAGKQLSFQSAGEAHLKGFDEPITLYEVGS